MMKRKFSFRKRLYCSIAVCMSLFAVCSNSLYAANDSQQSVQELKVGSKAPDFTVVKDGKSVSLSNDLTDIYVVINFSSASPEGIKITADMARLEKQYEDSDIAFVNIPLDENEDIAKKYGVSSAPVVCIVDLQGNILSIENENVDLTKRMKEILSR